MKIIRYGLVGATAATIDFSIFAVFAKWLGFNYLVVGCVGFIVATAVNYILSVRFVFQRGVRFRPVQEVALIFLVSGLGLVVNQGVLYVGIGVLGWEMLLTKVLATGSVFLWNFGIRSGFVFKASGKSG